MRKFLSAICIASSLMGMAQPNRQMNLVNYQAYVKSSIASGDRPLDGKFMYRDSTSGFHRLYKDVAEARTALIDVQRCTGLTVFINTGGTLANGVITGGRNDEFWWRGDKTDGGLVQKTINLGQGFQTTNGITDIGGNVTSLSFNTKRALSFNMLDDAGVRPTVFFGPSSGFLGDFKVIGTDTFAVKSKNTYIFSNDSLALTGPGITDASGTHRLIAISPSGRIHKSIITVADLGKNLYTTNGTIPTATDRLVGIPVGSKLNIQQIDGTVSYNKFFGYNPDYSMYDASVFKNTATDEEFVSGYFDDDGGANMAKSEYYRRGNTYIEKFYGNASGLIGARNASNSIRNQLNFNIHSVSLKTNSSEFSLTSDSVNLSTTKPLKINGVIGGTGQVIGNIAGVPGWVDGASGPGSSAYTFDAVPEPANPAVNKCVVWFDNITYKWTIKKNVAGVVTSIAIF